MIGKGLVRHRCEHRTKGRKTHAAKITRRDRRVLLALDVEFYLSVLMDAAKRKMIHFETLL